jgi:hypothetical protein
MSAPQVPRRCPIRSSTLEGSIQLLIPPCSLLVFLPPLYNQLSNEQGIGVENLYTKMRLYTRNTVFHIPNMYYGCDTPYHNYVISTRGYFFGENLLVSVTQLLRLIDICLLNCYYIFQRVIIIIRFIDVEEITEDIKCKL